MTRMNENGFTLVEVMVSLVLLGLVMTGGMSMFTNSNSFLRIALDKKIATELASTKLEEIRLQNFTAVPSNPAPTPIKLGDIWATDTTIYTGVDTGLMQVNVTIDWTQAGKIQSRNVQLTTYIDYET